MPVLYMNPDFDGVIKERMKTETRRGQQAPQKFKESKKNVEEGRDVHVTRMMKGIAEARYVVKYTGVRNEK